MYLPLPHAILYRFMLGLAAIPAVVRFVAFFFLPESPRWLVGRGKREAARAVLLRLRRGGGERREGGRGNEGGGGMEGEEEVERELKEIQENLEQNAKENSLGVCVCVSGLAFKACPHARGR